MKERRNGFKAVVRMVATVSVCAYHRYICQLLIYTVFIVYVISMCVIYLWCILTQGSFHFTLSLSHQCPGKSTNSWKSKLGRPSAQKQNVGRLEENGHLEKHPIQHQQNILFPKELTSLEHPSPRCMLECPSK